MKKYLLLILFFIFFISCKNNSKIKFLIKKPDLNINLNKYSFTSISNNSEKINLEKGTIYVLDFWYLECSPCVKDHKIIKGKIDFLKNKNIKVIGISIDRDLNAWKNYLIEHKYNWKNLNQYNNVNLKEDLKIKIFPTYLIIDGEGNIKEQLNSFKLVLNYFKYN